MVMAASTPEALMYQIVSRVEEVNHVASRMLGISPGVFGPVSLGPPKLNPAEVGFLRSISWLFVLYHEAGKVGVDFLADRLSTYGLDPNGRLSAHHRLVRQLRTFQQHNLDVGKSCDRATQQICEQWLRDQCGTPVPGTGGQWKRCLLALLSEALQFLEALRQTTRSIEQDESREEICREWRFRVKRYHPPHAFDDLIAKVATDMGREHVDPARLRTRFHEKWSEELDTLRPDYEFEIEARKLIERVLLTETTAVLPITGKDIMEEFDISPGPLVGELLQRARTIYDAKPCSRDILLGQLRQEVFGLRE
jgi:hypothetical protein